MGNTGEYALGFLLLVSFCVIGAYLFFWEGGAAMRDEPEDPPAAPPATPPPPAPPAPPAGPPSTGFEGGSDTPFVEIPPVAAATAATCATDHVGTYFEGGQCKGCPRPNFMHDDLNATNLNCDGPGGSSIVGAFTTLDATDYGDILLPGGPERLNVKCQLSKYYEETNGIGSCSDFPGGACNDEYCRASDGQPVPGSTNRGDCTSPNVWVGKYYSGRGTELAGDCNECDLTTNTIKFAGGSRTSFFNDFECEACTPGDSRLHVDNVGECVMCPDDHVYSEGPPATCTECTGGRKYLNAATTTCDDCPANKYHHRVGDNPAECHPKAGSQGTCWVDEGVQGPGYVSSQCTESKSCSKGNEQVLKCRTTNEHSCSAACARGWSDDHCDTSVATGLCSSGYCGYNGNCAPP